MTYDETKYRRLMHGDRVQDGDYILTESGPMPAGTGWHMQLVDGVAEVFLRPITEQQTEAKPVNIDEIASEFGITTAIGKRALSIAIKRIQLLDSKQQDYGSENIAAFGEYGVLVRVWDKVSRLKNLLAAGKEPKNESVMDSWADLGNYAIIAQICRMGDWK